MGFSGGLVSKESACSAGDLGSIPGLGKSPGEGNRYSLQCFCLENSMDRGAWQATVLGVTKSPTRLSDCHFQDWGWYIKKGSLTERFRLLWYFGFFFFFFSAPEAEVFSVLAVLLSIPSTFV